MMKRPVVALCIAVILMLAGCGKAAQPAADIDAGLDEFIHQCVMERNEGLYYHVQDGYANEAHDILGTAVSGNRITVYAKVLYREWRKENGETVNVSGGDIPTAVTVAAKQDGSYELIEYWEPRDGSYYAKDLEVKFPAEMRSALRGLEGTGSRFRVTQADAERHFSGGETNDGPEPEGDGQSDHASVSIIGGADGPTSVFLS